MSEFPAMGLLPEHALSPVRGLPRKAKKAPAALLAFCLEHGGRVSMTDPLVRAALAERGLVTNAHIAGAIHGLKRFYGMTITTERSGRVVTTYVVHLTASE